MFYHRVRSAVFSFDVQRQCRRRIHLFFRFVFRNIWNDRVSFIISSIKIILAFVYASVNDEKKISFLFCFSSGNEKTFSNVKFVYRSSFNRSGKSSCGFRFTFLCESSSRFIGRCCNKRIRYLKRFCFFILYRKSFVFCRFPNLFVSFCFLP